MRFDSKLMFSDASLSIRGGLFKVHTLGLSTIVQNDIRQCQGRGLRLARPCSSHLDHSWMITASGQVLRLFKAISPENRMTLSVNGQILIPEPGAFRLSKV